MWTDCPVVSLIYGEPPLGPGAQPHERLAAFYDAMIDLLDTHLHLALGAETGSCAAMADVLLAPLAPELYQHMRYEGLSRRQIADAARRLATLLR